MADQVGISNMALAEIGAAPIESPDEQSLEARETSRHFPQALMVLLECYEWSFALRRRALAAAVNPRTTEWAYAFALPVDVARPIGIVDAGWPMTAAIYNRVPYEIDSGLLFCNLSAPIFVYVSREASLAQLPSRFVDALVFELASRIVMPIKKSREMKGDLIKQAEVARQRAIADDANRQPQEAGWINRVEMARDGWADSYASWMSNYSPWAG